MENKRVRINHVKILLSFLRKKNYHMNAYQLENKCLSICFVLMNSQTQNLHHDAADIMNHWIACNIYTKTIKSIREKLEKMS